MIMTEDLWPSEPVEQARAGEQQGFNSIWERGPVSRYPHTLYIADIYTETQIIHLQSKQPQQEKSSIVNKTIMLNEMFDLGKQYIFFGTLISSSGCKNKMYFSDKNW